MKYTNSVMIVRTRKENIVGCHMIATRSYQKLMPDRFLYSGYICREFEVHENVGGQVKIKTYDRLEHAGIEFANIITFVNVTDIEIMSEHDI